MIHKCKQWTLCVLVLVAGLCPMAFGQTQTTGLPQTADQDSTEEVPFRVIANYKEQLENRIIARGNVEIHYKTIKLFADRVELDTETKDVFAEGHVVF